MQTPLEMPQWSQTDIRAFSSYRLSATDTLETIAGDAASNATRQGLFGVGGLKFDDLVTTLSRELYRGIGESAGLGATAMATYYRTIAARGYEIIEEDLPDIEIRYLYEGPLDNLTRPWCAKIMRQSRNGRRWTKEQIMAMASQNDRGRSQPPNVFTTCGGWNCRHQWILAPQKKKGAGPARKPARARTYAKQLSNR